jgi:hypothetical protein
MYTNSISQATRTLLRRDVWLVTSLILGMTRSRTSMGITMQLFGTRRNMRTLVAAKKNIRFVVDVMLDILKTNAKVATT